MPGQGGVISDSLVSRELGRCENPSWCDIRCWDPRSLPSGYLPAQAALGPESAQQPLAASEL